MKGIELRARRSDTPPHPVYFRGKGATMYLAGLVGEGRKRIVFELADAIGSGKFPEKLSALLGGLGLSVSSEECAKLLEAHEIRDFETTFKDVLTYAATCGKPLFSLYTGGPGTGMADRPR